MTPDTTTELRARIASLEAELMLSKRETKQADERGDEAMRRAHAAENALETIARMSVNACRTNSKDVGDWAEDVAYFGKLARETIEAIDRAALGATDGAQTGETK